MRGHKLALQIVILCSVFSLSLPFLGGCKKVDREDRPGEREEQARHVEVAIAETGEIVSSLPLTGTFEPLQEVKVTSKIPGRVEEVLVEEGQHVKRGDDEAKPTVLIQLEKEELALSVAQAEAALATAKAGLDKVLAGTRKEEIEQAKAAAEQARANAEMSKLTLDRMANLLEDESIAKGKYDEAKANYDVALAQYQSANAQYEMAEAGPTMEDVAVAEAKVEQAKAAVASANRQLGNATISSPINGVVTERNVEPGEVVSPPMTPGEALITVVDMTTLKTTVNISENRVKAVRLGQEAAITLDGFPGETFSGKVSKISPIVDPGTRTFEAEILTPNRAGRLKPGMFARVRLVLAKKTDAVKVPLKAVIEGERGRLVLVAGNGVAKARPVTLGISDGVDVEVLTGLDVGEEVVVRGNLGLEDGERIVLRAPSENR